MRKLHVYTDKNGEVVASAPAPDEMISKAAGGPVFVGFTPAQDNDGLTLFEVSAEDDLVLRRDGNIDHYHARLSEVIRAKKSVKQLDYRKDLGLKELHR